MKNNNNKKLYLAWQAPDTRDWHVVGSLSELDTGFSFNYTKGAAASSYFIPFSGMEDLGKTYVSTELFPLFKNRLLSERRPEYPKFIKWLALDAANDLSPLDILGRSGGIRGTDQLQTFQRIQLDDEGHFEHFFFSHGISYLNQSAQDRISNLEKGEKLYLCLDCQNEHDSNAVLVRTQSPTEIVGYCPRYLAKDITTLLRYDDSCISLSVEVIDKEAPSNYRLMLKLEGHVPKKYRDEYMDHAEYQVY